MQNFFTCRISVHRRCHVCLVWMSSAGVYWIVSRLLARLLERKYHPCNRKTRPYRCSRQLFIQGHGSESLSQRSLCRKRSTSLYNQRLLLLIHQSKEVDTMAKPITQGRPGRLGAILINKCIFRELVLPVTVENNSFESLFNFREKHKKTKEERREKKERIVCLLVFWSQSTARGYIWAEYEF